MKKKSLKSLIRKVRNDLDWPVLERNHEAPMIRVMSDPRNKSHVLLMPDKLHNRSSDLDYLHELGHATFCEKVHPIFASNSHFAAPPENKRQFMVIIPALNAACDWFIGHWQQELSPHEAREQLRENLKLAEEIVGDSKLPPLDIILDAAMLIAQAIHYLDEPIDCGGVLKVAVDAFLSIAPEKASAESCTLLVNRLMATYTDQRARLLNDDGFHVWDVYHPEGQETVTTPEPQSLSHDR